MLHRGLVLLLALSFSFCANAGSTRFPFRGLDATLYAWGVPTDGSMSRSLDRPLRIAVLDKTFLGYEDELGKTLPKRTQYFEGPVEIATVDPSAHGLRMAQMLSFIATQKMKTPSWIELRLYRVAGFTNFKAAIDSVIDWQADLVLHSEVWEVGGNSDGKGFINQAVSRATQAGILWVNAAGNFEGQAYQGPIEFDADKNVLLPNKNNRLTLLCRAPQGRRCSLRALLTWNSFHESSDEGTNTDLNFELLDRKGQVRGEGRLKQVRTQAEAPAGASKYPRESFATEIESGRYEFQVKAVSSKFSARDAFRLSVAGEFLELPEQTPGETLMNPADHPDVITVGAFDSEKSSLSRLLGKPEIWAPSSVVFEDGAEYLGSSNSAALVAGLIALKKMRQPEIGRQELLESALRFDWQHGSPLRVSVADGTTTCFPKINSSRAPSWVRPLLSLGGQWVQTSEGPKVMMPYDPLVLHPWLRRTVDVDRVMWTPEGWKIQPRWAPTNEDSVEVFQVLADATLCQLPFLPSGRIPVWQ